ncbi:MAG: hypothetical protein ACXAE3_04955 [Candidatus Kariarchaeaceae archaeon]|jgi:hypothetical protein
MEQDTKRDRLYQYWSEIPFTRDTTFEDLQELLNNPIRYFILNTMRDGIEDEYSLQFDLPRRHAFSIKELHTMHKEAQKGQNMTVQNFHFHMKNLVAMGQVQEIAELLEGRHYVKYYGRTAKMVENFDYDKSHEVWQKTRIQPMKQMILNLHPDRSEQEIEEILDEYLKHMLDYYLRMYSWMEENYNVFYNSGMDLRLFTFMSINFSSFDVELQKSAKQVATLLHLDRIEEYTPYTMEEPQ